MIGGGWPLEEAQQVEILDLSQNCEAPLPKLPRIEGGIGGVLNEEVHVFCGGFNYDSGSYSSECYNFLTGLKTSFKQQIPRAYSSAIQLDSGILVGGGLNSEGELDSFELIQPEKSSIYGHFPFTFYVGCLMKLENEIWAIGGVQNQDISAQSWTSKLPNMENWSLGSKLNEKRFHHGCGFDGKSNILAVFGGRNENGYHLSSTELMISNRNEFQKGPKLPYRLDNMAVLTHPESGSILALGGLDETHGGISSKILQLDCDSKLACQWHLLEAQLKISRSLHVAVLSVQPFNCTN